MVQDGREACISRRLNATLRATPAESNGRVDQPSQLPPRRLRRARGVHHVLEADDPAARNTPSSLASGFPLITDTAARLDVAKVRKLREHGVKTVFRYYSHLPPSLVGKDLQPEEAKIIIGEGLSIGSVFQHYNNCFRTFENNWGKEDAEQALRQAEAAGQPEGSAIYFGVDADWPYQQLRDPILKYFDDVKRAFEGSGIAVGIYSNGCICNAVREKGSASYFWLSGSTGHSGTQAFYNTGAWSMFQNALDITPPEVGFGIDTNIANPATQRLFRPVDRQGLHHPAPTASRRRRPSSPPAPSCGSTPEIRAGSQSRRGLARHRSARTTTSASSSLRRLGESSHRKAAPAAHAHRHRLDPHRSARPHGPLPRQHLQLRPLRRAHGRQRHHQIPELRPGTSRLRWAGALRRGRRATELAAA